MDANTQIRVAFEEAGMTPIEIADEFQMEVEAVKLALEASSSAYRKQCVKQPEEEDETLAVIRRIMLVNADENPNVALKAAKYLRDEKKGRNDAKAGMNKSAGGINVIVFNDMLAESRRRVAEMKSKLIDVAVK